MSRTVADLVCGKNRGFGPGAATHYSKFARVHMVLFLKCFRPVHMADPLGNNRSQCLWDGMHCWFNKSRNQVSLRLNVQTLFSLVPTSID